MDQNHIDVITHGPIQQIIWSRFLRFLVESCLRERTIAYLSEHSPIFKQLNASVYWKVIPCHTWNNTKTSDYCLLTLGSISSGERHLLTVLLTTSSNIKWTKLARKIANKLKNKQKQTTAFCSGQMGTVSERLANNLSASWVVFVVSLGTIEG